MRIKYLPRDAYGPHMYNALYAMVWCLSVSPFVHRVFVLYHNSWIQHWW